MNKYIKDVVSFIAVILLCGVMFLFGNALYNYGKQNEPHKHVIIEYRYANNVKKYTKEYCLTDSMQVILNGKHVETIGSRSYFRKRPITEESQ